MLERIRKLCIDHNISIRELEQACGFSRDTIAKWEDHVPRADRLKSVADYFGVTMDSLLKKDGA